ncbi:hypothetical protein PV05_08481 [Exophiala xenobiotica]|uniref:Condensation domain-containing protein n=1 Tax=Exophiala xenobiotica TaxID=348802 RepID=A0A0D2EBY1_9EURO|nr:uncharacterized protein PV05_08481 [Exophiala xenobiotica]KIW52868.1 hypothetical protein PV05_08481 [Exophiala xenobiotica]
MLLLHRNAHLPFSQESPNNKSCHSPKVECPRPACSLLGKAYLQNTISTQLIRDQVTNTFTYDSMSSASPSTVSLGSAPPSISPSETNNHDDRTPAVSHSSPECTDLVDASVLKSDGDIGGVPEVERHVIHLSSIEHCMPRSYIRICLAYRLPNKEMLPSVVSRLNHFVRKTVDAKPYLSGYVVSTQEPSKHVGGVEIHFSDRDYVEYPKVNIRHLTCDEVPYSYEELNEKGLPPSLIKPELVSALAESADEERAPVFRVQANVVEGGLIVSLYLHHCISDGTGVGLLISGSVLKDHSRFERHLDGQGYQTPSLSMRLDTFAHQKSVVRQELSYSCPNQINDRELQCKTFKPASEVNGCARIQGRGCVISIPLAGLAKLKEALEAHAGDSFISQNDALQALLWHSMTRARIPSLSADASVKESKLLMPVNIRNKLKKPLSEFYFGAAIDFASAKMPLLHLDCSSDTALATSALAIRRAIAAVNEPYIRQAIALARYADPNTDVRDLQASNMDRSKGADMYVTSWEKLPCYEATFEMGLGPPDWVRKPWSRDPGSCIVLPQDERKDYLEVVIQMTEDDMARLLEDQEFMKYVSRVIE